jgi:ABC-2 type transport system ATP-binding protein
LTGANSDAIAARAPGDQKIALSLKDIRKAYRDVVAVDRLHLEVLKGECFGLLGPNGAGKTTTIEICEGLTEADSGDVQVLGMTWASDADELRQRLGIQLQETQLSEKMSVIETMRLFRSFFRQGPQPDVVIAMVQLDQKRDAWVRTLSGGQKQRLALACSLAGDPEFLFLDEPTTGLDTQSRRHFWDLIKQFKLAGRTILLTTHYMSEAEELCDRVAIMDGGKVIATGTPRELTSSLRAEHIVEFAAGDDAKPLDVGRLERIEGVCSVNSDDGGKVRMQVRELHSSLPAILDELARQGVPLASLRTHSATLEDVFVVMTGRNLRDE